MKQLLEFIPIILFFVVYQMDGDTLSVGEWSHTVDGIFTATGVLIGATLIQLPLVWLITGEIEKRLIWTALAVVVFGGATLALRDELFIQWKPSVFNWGMALVFAGSQYIGSRNMLQRLMGSQLKLPTQLWRRVCWVWVLHFTVVGIMNLVVAYNFEEATWVAYKLYSGLGFTLLLMTITAVMIGPTLKRQEAEQDAADSEFHP